MKTNIQVTGMAALGAVLGQMERDFGYKEVESKVLVPAVREAMRPVLMAARGLVPKDTGALARSLQIEARRPNSKDKRSRYIKDSDVVVAAITTAPGKKLAKMGIKSDARAVAMEFGTAKVAAQPYMRDALESQSTPVVNTLATILGRRMEQYRAKNTK